MEKPLILKYQDCLSESPKDKLEDRLGEDMAVFKANSQLPGGLVVLSAEVAANLASELINLYVV